ncbi:DUF6153 family protein [Microbacterium sp. SY138]|uniref:DUF6153 family protein n=1 Tax=unclassified Microbacterium TaxID=2609290 RepID=UPI003219B9BF
MISLSALRTRLPRSTRWLLVVCFSVAIIVGLLGMHTLASSHAPAMSSTTAEMAGSAVSEGHHGAASAPAEHSEHACATCSPEGGHDALMVMCVLALLATVLFLLVPRLIGLSPHGRAVWWSVVFVARPAPSRPPSLRELSISRT